MGRSEADRSRRRNFLFVCGKNRLRSPTAEAIFADTSGIAVLSAGVNRDADERVSDELIEWADIIFVMEREHRRKLQAAHAGALKDTHIAVLGIPDDYAYMDPELTAILRAKMARWLPR
ncbi:low molecular weight protein tyrosine phosphatase family protein [Erythrobacter sp. MTPC3]|uniref:low molecular weight protein tyrosine phosphatase family protein n=1 Tax=Erythrobacter sp. MTPC3 TaxID=3056564 RepID=UPI0036F294FC